MNADPRYQQGKFYLLSVDILKGIAIFPMILGHSVGWWDQDLSRNYEEGSLAIIIILITGLMVFPCFLFLYGFNQVNSFLKNQRNDSYHTEIRSHALKRTCIFFVFASLALVLMAIIRAPGNPEKILNYLFTWHLLHLFAFSTLFLLILWELSNWFARRTNEYWDYQKFLTFLLLLSFIIVIILFILFHDYTVARENTRVFPVPLEIISILENIFLDISSCGIIPWLSFVLAGGITASLFKLTCIQKNNLVQKIKLIISVNMLFLIFGIYSLRFERFISAGLGYASSFSHLFISIGLIGVIFAILTLELDIRKRIPHKTSFKLFYPIFIVSNISLTVYLIHPVVGVIHPSLIPSETVLLFLISLYCLFFVILAHFWQKWDFKFSFEWIIKKFS